MISEFVSRHGTHFLTQQKIKHEKFIRLFWTKHQR